jgi:membrane protein implicated in regulation of membrane protease activity
MGNLSALLSGWNLVFLIAIGVAILLALVAAVAGFGDGDADADGGHAADAGDTADASDAGDADGDANDHPLSQVFHSIGIGSVPLTILLQAFLLFFGIGGLAANRTMASGSANGSIGTVLFIAFLTAFAAMAFIGALARRFMPKDEPATGSKDLIGRTGSVVYEVSSDGGTAQVRDASGTLHQIAARVPTGHTELQAGSSVIVVAFDAERGAFIVDENPFSTSAT